MPGQGFHYGFSRLVAERVGKEVTEEIKVGTLVLDALNSAAGSRRNSHFCGGAGCIIPRYTELRQSSKIQSWDSGYKKSFLVDPRIEMRLFEAVNIHIPEDDYKSGLRLHLLSDRSYDQLVQTQLFDVSNQQNNIIRVRKDGREMDGASFRKELYASYPMLDNYLLRKAGVTAKEIEDVKILLRSTLCDEHAEFIIKYLNFNSEYEWHDTEFFSKELIEEFVEEAVESAIRYLKW